MAELKLFLLGSPRFEKDGSIVSIEERKAIALLAYLAVSGIQHSRDTMATLLWPKQSQANARASLRHALWSIKASGLEDYMYKGKEEIGLHPRYWLDVFAFHKFIEEYRLHNHAPGDGCSTCLTALANAVGLYRDDYFAGFSLRDAPQFDEWQYYQREQYRQILAFALEHLARSHDRRGEVERAIEYARRWVSLDPLHEPAQRWLMRIYAYNGKRTLALKQYETLLRTLREELRTEPEAETSGLADAIRSRTVMTGAVEPSVPEVGIHLTSGPSKGLPLLEREIFLEKLEDLLQEIRTGEGRMVFLGGEAGVGKTSLIRHFRARVRKTARVMIGICDPLSTPRPLGPLWDIAVEVGGDLSRLLHAEGKPEHIFHTFLEELRHERHSYLVVFEDVHWGDEATLDLLRFLGRRVESTHALVIASFRDDEIDGRHPLRILLGDLANAPGIERVHLPPLSRQAVDVLLAGSGLDPANVYRKTGGNPFFVTEILASGIDRVPETVRDAVLVRAARLTPAARSVLDSVAVMGPSVDVPLLMEMAESEAAVVEECFSSGVLLVHGDAMAFRHELARQAILESISPPRLLLLHRQALEVLRAFTKVSGDLARLAHHAEGAADSQAVLEYAPAAARQAAAAGAHRQAAAQYERALRFSSGLPAKERAQLLQAYARECKLCDRINPALQAFEEAAQLCQETGNRLEQGSNLNQQADCLYLVGRYAEAIKSNRSAVEILSALPASPQLAQAYRKQASFFCMNSDYDAAVTLGKKAIEIGERVGDIQTLIRAHNTIGVSLIYKGEAGGRAWLERSIALSEEVNDHAGVALGYCNLGRWTGMMNGWDVGTQYIAEGLAYCAEFELDFHNNFLLTSQASVHLYQGHWSKAEETVKMILSERNLSFDTRFWALEVLGHVLARRGDPGSAAVLDEAFEVAENFGILQFLAPARAARAEAAWLAGDLDRTREEAGPVYNQAVQKNHVWYTGELAFWLWRAGEEVNLPDWAMPVFAAQIRGDWAGAASDWQRRGCPYERAWALTDGDVEAGLFALEIFDQLGAAPAAAILRRRLRAQGAHRSFRGPKLVSRSNS